jgi:hypothetical protein
MAKKRPRPATDPTGTPATSGDSAAGPDLAPKENTPPAQPTGSHETATGSQEQGGVWQGFVSFLLQVRTGIQLIGFVVLIGGVVAYRTTAPDQVPGAIAAGSFGLFLMAFGLVLSLASSRRTLQQPLFLLGVLFLLGTFIVILFYSSLHHIAIKDKADKDKASKEQYKLIVTTQHNSNMAVLRDMIRTTRTLADMSAPRGALFRRFDDPRPRLFDLQSELVRGEHDLDANFMILVTAIESGDLVLAVRTTRDYNSVAARLNQVVTSTYGKIVKAYRLILSFISDEEEKAAVEKRLKHLPSGEKVMLTELP